MKTLALARQIQKAFRDNYLKKVEKVKVTADNVQSLLFSVCTFEDEEQKEEVAESEKASGRLGILVNYAVEKESSELKVFINLFKTKNPRIQATKWVSLSKNQVYSDLSLGLVSQQWLESFATHDIDSVTKLR